MNKALAQKMLAEICDLTHWGTQGICDHFLREHLCVGVYGLAKAVTEGCIICQKVNQKAIRKTTPRGREIALRPFQNIQVDFTEMPPVQGYRHLLVIVDYLNPLGGGLPYQKGNSTSSNQNITRVHHSPVWASK